MTNKTVSKVDTDAAKKLNKLWIEEVVLKQKLWPLGM